MHFFYLKSEITREQKLVLAILSQLKALYIWAINIFDLMIQHRCPLVAHQYELLSYLDIVPWATDIAFLYLSN